MSFIPVSKTLQSKDGTIIYADAIGNPTNPGVVFIHGSFLNAVVFDNLFADKSLLDKLYLVSQI
jgi:pimeloyl-ACP methyl ester carboxylesterase